MQFHIGTDCIGTRMHLSNGAFCFGTAIRGNAPRGRKGVPKRRASFARVPHVRLFVQPLRGATTCSFQGRVLATKIRAKAQKGFPFTGAS